MVQSLVNSIFNSQSYSVHGILIDPGDEWEAFYGVAAVLLTHAHFDHIYGLNRVIELNPSALVYTNQYGREALLSDRKNMSRYHGSSFVFAYPENIRIVSDGSILRIDDGTVAKAVFTPGHHPSCVTWVIGDCVFSGDSYIPGIKVVTNLPGGNKEDALRSQATIMALQGAGLRIYSGHIQRL